MADKFVNETGVAAIRDWVNSKIASQGGDPNVIEIVKVNNTALTPDANKAVNVECWQGSILSDGTSTFSDFSGNNMQLSPTQNGVEYIEAGSSAGSITELASVDYVDANGGKIDSISVNGVAQTIDANKNVDITIPEEVFEVTPNLTEYADIDAAITAGKVIVLKVSGVNRWQNFQIRKTNRRIVFEAITGTSIFQSYQVNSENVWDISSLPIKVGSFQNDAGYQTATDVDNKIATAVSSAYKYKGSVATVNDLPSTGQTVGDVYDVQSNGMNYAWNGTSWDSLGQVIDTSVLWTSQTGQSNSLNAMTVAEINAILNPVTP